jgi:hypothetical protein
MGRVLIVVLSLAWLGWELIAALDGNPDTLTLTEVIVTYVPPWLYIPAVIVLAIWLPWHFWTAWRGSLSDGSLSDRSLSDGSLSDRSAKAAVPAEAPPAAAASSEASPDDRSVGAAVGAHAKPIAAAFLAFGGVLAAAADEGVTSREWLTAVLVGLATFAVVGAIPISSRSETSDGMR